MLPVLSHHQIVVNNISYICIGHTFTVVPWLHGADPAVFIYCRNCCDNVYTHVLIYLATVYASGNFGREFI